ncbi:MAG: hemolysin family protein [Desulfovibrionaceae bacterium]|nr:hemolysin family protein [Desulfovibrionaceae bacterium]
MYAGFMLALAIFLVFLNGFFVAAEFSFVKVRKTRLEILSFKGNSLAKTALFGVHNLDAYLSVCQLGITLASLGLGWIGEPAIAGLIEPLLALTAITSPALVHSTAVVISFICITFMHVVLGELMPKSLAIQQAERMVLFLALPMKVFYYLSFPIVCIMNAVSRYSLHFFGIRSAGEAEEHHSREELRMIINNSSKDGDIVDAEGRMLNNIFDFYQKKAKDVMIHRLDVQRLEISEGVEAAIAKAKKSGHTRFPVFNKDTDQLVGFIHVKDLLHYDSSTTLRALLRTALFVQESLSTDKLLHLMQEKRQQICAVIDEYGVWQGIVTMEDLVEAIVGNIQDEFDNEAPDFVRQPDGSALVSAALSLDELEQYMPLPPEEGEEDDYKILAAHILDKLGRIPNVGDSIVLHSKLFTVAAMNRQRICRILIQDLPPEQAEAGKDAEAGTEHRA